MKPLSLLIQTRRGFLLFVAASAFLSLSLAGDWQTATMQKKPATTKQQNAAKISLGDVMTGLRSKLVSLSRRNELLIDAVNKRGVTFTLTPEIEREMRAIGASDLLIQTIRQKNLQAASSQQKPPAPVPNPIFTPAIISNPTSEPVQLQTSAAKKPQASGPVTHQTETDSRAVPPADAFAYKNNADELRVKGNDDAALSNYNRAIQLKPDFQEAYYNRGLSYQNKREYDRSIVDFDKAIELNRKDPMAFYSRGVSFHYKGVFDRALKDYRTAVKLKPAYFSKESIGCLLYDAKTDSPAAAILSCSQVIAALPKFSLLYFVRGNLYAEKKDYAQAVKDYDKAINLYPNFASAYRQRALTYEKLGRNDLAAADHKKVKQLEP